jgi:hypothetical protein
MAGLAFASLPALAQDPARVLFCTGQCFAVDANGVRTAAPKGVVLLPGQHLETGPNSYAQLKIGQDVAMGVGESAQVRFDRGSASDRDIVTLERGRIRVLEGEALGKIGKRPVELRTTNGILTLRGADLDVKAAQPGGTGDAGLTVVKLNGGDARMLQSDVAIRKDIVQGIDKGALVTDRPLTMAPIAAITTAPRPVSATPPTFTSLPPTAPILRSAPVMPTVTGLRPLVPQFVPPPPPVVRASDTLLASPVIDPVTNTSTTLTRLVTEAPPATIAAPTTTRPITTTIILAPTFTSVPRTTTFIKK